MESLQNKLENQEAGLLFKLGAYVTAVAWVSAIYYFGKEVVCKYGLLFCEAVERWQWSSLR